MNPEINPIENTKTLAILLLSNGFFYVVKNQKGEQFSVSKPNWYNCNNILSSKGATEMEHELKTNLVFKQAYEKVIVGFNSVDFQIVPNDFAQESWSDSLNYLIQNNKDLSFFPTPIDAVDAQLYFGIPKTMKQILLPIPLIDHAYITHSLKVLVDALMEKNVNETVYLNLIGDQLDVIFLKDNQLIFCNSFVAPTEEDVLFFVLFVLEQLNLQTAEIKVKTIGELTASSNKYQLLRKYILSIEQLEKDEDKMKHYVLYNLLECALYQDH